MIKEFEKYAGIKILSYFIFHSEIEIHIKELARNLKMSPSTTKFYCDTLHKKGLLNIEEKGNLKIFSMNNGNFFSNEVKKTFALSFLNELGIEKLSAEGTIALYGSYSNGTFDEKSDWDLLVIGKEDDIDRNIAFKIEKASGKNVQLSVIPYYEWEKMKNRKEPFAKEVLLKHVVIKGSEL